MAILSALPYATIPVITAIRVARSRSLNDESADPGAEPVLVTVVIPARNEELNIERCLRSVLTSTYPELEVIVVNDHSTDATGGIASSIAVSDPRLSVIDNPSLPEGWFGKQWACHNGARAARGEIILFADADTVHSAELIVRAVNAMEECRADLFSVAGKQELGSFWEKLVQPQIFMMLAVRYGGTETITRSRFAVDKIANGQCLLVRRSTYEEVGGHGLVRSHVADDMMLAQRFFSRGKHVAIVMGTDQLSTRMYTSFGELVRGWGKNVFAGGRDAVPFGKPGRAIFPFALLSAPVWGFLPALLLLASVLVAIPSALILWAAIAQTLLLLWWLFLYRIMGESPLYALLSPVGAALVFYIFARAVSRGQTVSWKGRVYRSG